MSVNLHVRDVPDDIHETLVRRANARRMSLRQYVIDVLADHTSLPTMNEWLDEVRELTPAPGEISSVDAVNQAREEDDEHLWRVLRR